MLRLTYRPRAKLPGGTVTHPISTHSSNCISLYAAPPPVTSDRWRVSM